MNHLKIANNMIAGFYERGKDSTPTDVGQAAASVIAAHALIAIAEQLEKMNSVTLSIINDQDGRPSYIVREWEDK